MLVLLSLLLSACPVLFAAAVDLFGTALASSHWELDVAPDAAPASCLK